MNPFDDLLATAGRVDEMTPGQLRRGRATLEASIAAAASASPVRAAGPVSGTGSLRAAGPVAAAGPVNAAGVIGGGRQGGAVTGRLAGYSLRRRLVLGGIAVAACAALITVPTLINAGGSGAEASAATLLRAAGNAAAKQHGGWPDAAYWRVVSVYKRTGKTYHREIWVAHHGTSVLRDDGVAAGVLPLGPGEFPAGGTALTWDQLYALPTDPGKLTAVLDADIKGAGPDPQSELFTIVGDLLRESPAPPALRKALYDVAAGIPGVHLTGRVTDALDRPGTGVERGGETLVVDPADGALLADYEPGWDATFVKQGRATSAPAASPASGKPS